MRKKAKTVPFRSKREGKTDYNQRLKLLKSRKPRLIVRKSLNNIIAQIAVYAPEGDSIVASASSAELKKFGWKANNGNMPSAYLVGLLIGKKAKAKNIEGAVLDVGLSKSVKGSKSYAVLAGALEAGLTIPHGEIIPNKERLTGKHIADYAKELKKDEAEYKKRFSKYLQNNLNPEEIVKECEDAKKRIIGVK